MMTDSPLRRRFLLGLAAVLLLPASPASARRGRVRFRAGGLPGHGPYEAGILSQDKLEHCLRLESEINTGAEAIDTEEAGLTTRQAEIERLGREIDVQAARVDRYSQASVNSDNRLVGRHRSMVGDFNARLPSFNACVEAHNARISDFNTGCAQKRYYEADMQTVRSRLGLN